MFSRAVLSNVGLMIVTGTDIAISRKAVQLAERYPKILRATAGVHPHHAQHLDAKGIGDLRKLAESEYVCAIGETGLDFNRNRSTPEAQIKAFREQVQLAVDLRLPLFVHEREAHEDLLKVLDEFEGRLPGVCIHCFTGTEKELREYVRRGYYVGITGFVAKKKRGKELREMLSRSSPGAPRLLPLDRLMIETDAPYMCPDNIGAYARRNEPCTLPAVLEAVSACYGGPAAIEEVARRTTANAMRFFARMPQGVGYIAREETKEVKTSERNGTTTTSQLKLEPLRLSDVAYVKRTGNKRGGDGRNSLSQHPKVEGNQIEKTKEDYDQERKTRQQQNPKQQQVSEQGTTGHTARRDNNRSQSNRRDRGRSRRRGGWRRKGGRGRGSGQEIAGESGSDKVPNSKAGWH
mmetsp:Transcript_8891/g.21869  ORF Transcript_8891/g.21869 Transcript_8891/m.21869 type:complete len:406 (-) Transcript_8891:1741-2958(-)